MALFEDREANLWVGTHGGGLARLRDSRFIAVTTADGLVSSYVKSVTVGPDGRVWVGTYGGGLNVIEGGRVRVVDAARGLPTNQVRSVLVGRDGGVWVGTTNGLARLDGQRVRTWGAAEGLPGPSVNSLWQGPDGAIWVGTSGGLARFADGRLAPYGEAEGLAAGQVGPVRVTRDGALWVGTYGAGLMRVQGGQTTRFGEREGLLGQTVLALHEDSRGSLWAGTSDGGLARLVGERFLSLTTQDGLHQDGIFDILEDDQGALWLPGNHGIFKVALADIERFTQGQLPAIPGVVYGAADGMPGRQCSGGSQPNAWRTPDGRLWFATNKGLALFDPRRTAPLSLAPPVAIESVHVDGRSFKPPLPARATFEPGEGRLEFRYAALTFVATERVRYRYKLEGFDRDWVEAGRRRDAYYTNIPAGQYVFRVVAASGDGQWNEAGASFSLELRPRLYERRWFQVLLAAGVLLLGLLLHRARVWSLEARSREMRQLVEERTARLREEVERSERALGEAEEARAGLERANLQLERANRQLRALSYVDDLTGLANRRHFNALLDEEWRRAARARAWLALVMIDVDHFKELNDSLGHDEGDRCLVQLGQALLDSLRRAGDVVARHGGEEFAVLVPGAQPMQAAVLAEQLRRRVEDLGLRQAGISARVVTISAGVAACQPTLGEGPEQLVKAADEALYAAKRGGRNRVCSAPATPPA
jgi:diguanylate cyclase (GGDEF)-like protein